MKKALTLLSVTVGALTLSGCCFFMSPPAPPATPAKPAAVVPAPAPVVVTPALVPAPLPPVDSDKDGVIDEKDQCPGTAAGVAVDAKGCPLDSDKDGVIDSLDQCPNTRAGLSVDSKGCPPPIEENVKIAIGALFASGKADIREDSAEDIKKLGVFMQTYPTTTTIIEGHTDSVGSAALNKDLSQRRAEAVRQYLIKNYNIDANRIKAVGYGPDRPVADNATAAGRQKNRRIEAAIDVDIVKPQE
jgi:OOP family OmpA-OmpF porin